MNVRKLSERCEDYPCCGHGPAPQGDDGGCPIVFEDVDTGKTWEQWPCASCGVALPIDNKSALCDGCLERALHPDFWEEDRY